MTTQEASFVMPLTGSQKTSSFSDGSYPLSVKKKLGSTGHRFFVNPKDEDQVHVWPQVWCYHTWSHTCAHRRELLLMCVLMCGIFIHMRPHVWILPHLWPQVWVNHRCVHTRGHTCGLLLRCVLICGLLLKPIDTCCSNDLAAAHYRLAHAFPIN